MSENQDFGVRNFYRTQDEYFPKINIEIVVGSSVARLFMFYHAGSPIEKSLNPAEEKQKFMDSIR